MSNSIGDSIENGSSEARPTEARLGRALVALQNSTGVLSSNDWTAAADVPTGDAWKLAADLRALGVEVDGSASAGWRLTAPADVALPEVLEPFIAGTIFAGTVRHFASIGSTNAAAMRAGAQAVAQSANASPNSTDTSADELRAGVWLAEEQTAGKGRAGHIWKSNPTDGIYCSALLRPKVAPADVIIFSLAAGLAVVEAVHEVTGLWGDLRWPNDVLIGGKKFCGILTELNAEVTRVRYLVAGMGINVNNAEFPPELQSIATSLYLEAGRRFQRVELVAALLRALHREQAALTDHTSTSSNAAINNSGVAFARERILRRFEQHSSYCCGCPVWVEEDGGYEGITRGLDSRGFLQIETPAGLRTVLSGGVRKR